MRTRIRVKSVHRLGVMGICAVALIVLPGTSVWATARAVVESTLGGFSDVGADTTPGSLDDTVTVLVSGTNPSELGQSVTFTATVTPTEGSTTPDGTVDFDFGDSTSANDVPCTAAPGDTCTAEVTHVFTGSGDFTVNAAYDGGTNHNPSVADALVQTATTCSVNPLVTTNADDGPGSLRQALVDACSGPGYNAISFDCTVASPITLTSGELSLTKDVVIDGPGASSMTITRDGGAGPFRIFHVQPGVAATISGLTVTGGAVVPTPPYLAFDRDGGGILNHEGTLTLQRMVVTGNHATGYGSGVLNGTNNSATSATLTVLDSTISGNGSLSAGPGAGLANYAVGMNSQLTMTIRRSTINGNQAGGDGGAIRNEPFRGNITLTATDTTISGNTSWGNGGGISNLTGSGFTSDLTLINATVYGNQTTGGSGGGIYTVATATLQNTIVAGNGADVVGWLSDSYYNLIGNGDGATGVSHGAGGNLVGTAASPIDPKLAPLADNGGPTHTHALLPGSPALDAGDNSFPVGSHDQRGSQFERLRDSNDENSDETVDMGAFEAQVSLPDFPDLAMVEDQPTAEKIVFPVGDTHEISNVSVNSSPLMPSGVLTVTGGNTTPQTLIVGPPPASTSGTFTVTVKVHNGSTWFMADTFLLTIANVNDPPTLDAIADPAAILEDAAEQTVNLTGITAGLGESQALTVTATSSNTSVIPDPTVTYTSADTSGTLSYTPIANAHGSALITVTVDDGDDTVTETFTVVVDPVADTAAPPAGIAVFEDQTATIVINRNAVDGSEVTHFQITNITAGSLFLNDGVTAVHDGDFVTFAQGNAGLKFTMPAGTFGSDQITVQSSLSDQVAGLGGGLVVVNIAVNPQADTPTVTDSSTTLNTQTTTGLVIDRNSEDDTEVAFFKITNITNGTLYQFDGLTPINNNDFITFAQGNAGLKFSPTTDSTATGSFRVQGAVDALGSGLSPGFATATITLPCTTDPVVMNSNDAGADSLRMALGLACAGSTITFDTGLVGNLIIVFSDQLTIDKDVTIDGPGANQLTVQGQGVRIMNILPGHTVTIRDLTLANGFADNGAAIYNSQSALTIEHSTFIGNWANGGAGGAIYNEGLPASASLTIVNSTLNANTASTYGGAIYSVGSGSGTGTVTLTNSTLSSNSANFSGGGLSTFGSDAAHAVVTVTNSTITNNFVNNDGGGLASGAATITLHNTIVAGNFAATPNPMTPVDVSSVLQAASSHNLIGVETSMAGITNGVNFNQVGTAATPIDPRLGPLQDNGGPTLTHALLAGSPALDAGDNAFVVDPPFLTPFTDQRGTGFSRILDASDPGPVATVDIGAYEAGASLTDILDQATAEETPLFHPFVVSDGVTSVTATSDNPVLVPNVAANLDVTGGGENRMLAITPAVDQTGTATITVTVTSATGSMTDTFLLTVNAVNDQPTLDPITNPPAIDEDAVQQLVSLAGISAGDSENQTLVVTATSDNTAVIPDPAVLYNSGDTTGLLAYTPVANESGTATITVTVNDSGGGTETIQQTFTVTVNAVNDPPTLDAIADPAAIDEEAGEQTVNLAGIGAGGGETQTLTVTATSNNTGLIPDPTVTYTSANAIGSLSYTPVADATGAATITVTVNDGGGGTETFSRTFLVTVNDLNDPPTLDAIPDPAAIAEDAAQQTVNLTGISAGGGESQTLTVTATSDNTALIPNPTVGYGSGNATGFLNYTPVANQGGTALITVTVTDDGAGTNTFSRTFTVTVDAVNDAPTLDSIGNPAAILEDAGLQTVNLAGITAGGGETQTLTVTASSDNTALIPHPTVSYASANVTGSLSYTPVADANGSAVITVTVTDDGGGTNTATQTFTVQVTSQNDPPTIAPIGSQQMPANTSLNVSPSIGDVETPAGSLAVTATSNNQTVMPDSGLVVTGSGATRTLTITPALNQGGTATITVTVTDANSGQTSTSFQLQVLPTIAVGDAMVVEGNSGTNLLFPVSVIGPAAGAVSVNFTTRQGTAIAGVDYASTGGILTIPTGETSGTISIPVTGDTAAEIDETFVVELSGATGAVLGTSEAVGTIITDDLTPPMTAERVDFARLAGASELLLGTLTKTGADGWNAGGSSARAIASGDGSVEFSVSAIDQGVAVGLSRGDSNTELADIDFAIVPFLGTVYVVERGVSPGSFGAYAAGDRFAIVVSGGVVSYQHNGVTFYTSTVAPQYPLLVDAALYTATATVEDVVVAGSLATTPRRLGDFDGDGLTDVIIYRPSSGQWFTLLSAPNYTEFTAIAHGNPPDVPVTGDYDGDRVADIAVFRPDTSTWDILKSSTYFTTTLSKVWGTVGDVPVPADYDGDGVTDIAVFRPTTSEWWVLTSSSNFTAADVRLWGSIGDVPVQGDYDGDGLADPAIFRPSMGEWWVLQSSTNYATFTITPWGVSTDVTVPGDFDGDGKFDPTVYRAFSGTWFSLLSSTNYTTFLMTPWGAPEDVPVMGDYDGDGQSELAVFRPSTGAWWVLRSAEDYTSYMPFLWGYGAQYPALRRQ